MKPSKWIAASLAAAWLMAAASASAKPDKDRVEFLTEALVGKYQVLGQTPQGKLYKGSAQIKRTGDGLVIIRHVGGMKTEHDAIIGTITADDIVVLKSTVPGTNEDIPVTYEMAMNAGNYFNLTGWAYESSAKRPGRDVLFGGN